MKELEERKGYVESSLGNSMVFRVPAADFQVMFAFVLNLGEVVHREIRAQDVTATLSDLKARQILLVATRERLYQLLEKQENVEEKLLIGKEIRRLTEQLEEMKATLAAFEGLVAYSRISIEFQARLQDRFTGQTTFSFLWMSALNPDIKPGTLAMTVHLPLGERFAVDNRNGKYYAESPEGVKISVGIAVNKPTGNALFWQKALAHGMGPLYSEKTLLDLAHVKAVLFKSKHAKPFYYLVALTVVGNDIRYVQVMFPDDEALAAQVEHIKESLKGFEVQ